MDFIWKALLLVLGGMILLRFSGRKSIAQMTISQTVVMISIGSIIVSPIANDSPWKALGAAAIFISVLYMVEILNIKFNFIEKISVGQSVLLMENGEFIESNMKKLRVTVDQVEMHLRQQGINKFEDVKTITMETNGEIGYELQSHAKPVTMGDLEKLLPKLMQQQNSQSFSNTFNIFDEVSKKGHPTDPPERLQ